MRDPIRTPSARYDVAIVGGGPGGSAAAWALAREGFGVALIDADRFPRDKPCGDGLTSASIAALQEMGLADLLDPACRVDGIAFHTLDQVQAVPIEARSIPLEGRIIPRHQLDARLVARACEAGAELFEGVTVRDVTCNETGCRVVGSRAGQPVRFHARFLIGADGARSIVARKCGMGQRAKDLTGVAMRGYFRTANQLPAAFHIALPLAGTGAETHCAGYGWLFPVGPNTVNVGVGYFPTRAGVRMPNPREVYEQFVADLAVHPLSAGLIATGPARGGLLASGCLPERCHNGRALLVGDAAGLVDPLTGEGIDAALGSGLLAAEVIAASDRAGTADLSLYAAGLRERFAKRIEQSTRLQQSYPLLLKVAEQATRAGGGLFAVASRARNARPESGGYFRVVDDRSVDAGTRGQLQDSMSAVEAGLQASVEKFNPVLWSLARKIIEPDESSLRLACLFMPGLFRQGQIEEEAQRAATALELCKLALEFHGLTGEGLQAHVSVDRKWTNSFLIMAGDYLLAEGYLLLATLGSPVRLMVGRAATRYCAARIERLHCGEGYGGGVAAELALAEQTLGGLCGLAGAVGAHLAGCVPDAIAGAQSAGTALGVAGRIAAEIEELRAGGPSDAVHAERVSQGKIAFTAALLAQRAGNVPRQLAALLREQIEQVRGCPHALALGLSPLAELIAGQARLSSEIPMQRRVA